MSYARSSNQPSSASSTPTSSQEDDGLTLVDTHAPARAEEDPRRGGGARRADPADRADPRARRPHRLARRARRRAARRRGADLRARRAAAREGQDARSRRAAGRSCSGGYPGAKTARRATFAPGDRVGSLEVHAAPGHTPGQVAFLDPRDGTLYCADAYSTLGGVATTAKPNRRFPLPGLATWHGPTALESRGRCARSTPRGSRPATAGSSSRPARRWTARSRAGPEPCRAAASTARRSSTPRARSPTPRGSRRSRSRASRPRSECARRRSTTTSPGATGCCAGSPRSRRASWRSELRRAATGRAGTDAIVAVAAAQRAYALAHPGRYATTVAAPGGRRRRARAGGGRRGRRPRRGARAARAWKATS